MCVRVHVHVIALEKLFLLWIRQLWIAWQSRCYLLPIDKVSILNCWWWRCVLIKYLWLKKTHILHLISMRQWSSSTTTILPFVHYLFLVFVFFFVRCRLILKKKTIKITSTLCFFPPSNGNIWGQHAMSSNHFLLFTCGFLSNLSSWKLTWHTSSIA